jgi:hypothetical protein
VVQPKKEVNPWQQQKAINNFSLAEWKKILKEAGFRVKLKEKERLGFFYCLKDYPPIHS